jgi:hypothetical protein
MKAPSLTIRMKNFLRFRSAASKLDRSSRREGGSPGSWLSLWRQVADDLGFEFVPGEPLHQSSLRGRHGGLDTTVTLHWDEIRVMTRFVVALPGPPVGDLLERLAEVSGIPRVGHELIIAAHTAATRRARLVSEVAAYRLNPVEEPESRDVDHQLGFSRLGLSERELRCDARYIDDLASYRDILRVMGEVARTLTG